MLSGPELLLGHLVEFGGWAPTTGCLGGLGQCGSLARAPRWILVGWTPHGWCPDGVMSFFIRQTLKTHNF